MTKKERSSTSTTKGRQTAKDGIDPTQVTWTTTTGGHPDIKVGDAVQIRNAVNPEKWFEDYLVVRIEPNAYIVVRHFYSDCAGGEKSSQHGAPVRVTLNDMRPQAKPPRIMPPLYGWNTQQFCTKYVEKMIKDSRIWNLDELKRY